MPEAATNRGVKPRCDSGQSDHHAEDEFDVACGPVDSLYNRPIVDCKKHAVTPNNSKTNAVTKQKVGP
jgi:hypothetical protein